MATLNTHIAFIGLVHIDATGKVISKQDPISHQMNFSTESRILLDSANANTQNNPTIEAYLTLENAAGYAFKQMGPTFLITEHP